MNKRLSVEPLPHSQHTFLLYFCFEFRIFVHQNIAFKTPNKTTKGTKRQHDPLSHTLKVKPKSMKGMGNGRDQDRKNIQKDEVLPKTIEPLLLLYVAHPPPHTSRLLFTPIVTIRSWLQIVTCQGTSDKDF